MHLIDFLRSPAAYALGWALLHAIWQGFALVLLTAVALHLLRTQSSALRYRVGVLTLAFQLLVSAVTFIWYYKPAVNSTPVTAVLTRQVTSIGWQTVAQTGSWHQQAEHFLDDHLSQFVLIYLLGVMLFGLRLAGGWLYLQRLSRIATSPTTKTLVQLTRQLRSVLVIRPVVRVLESTRIATPMVIGVLKPILLLPIGLATHLTTGEIELVLAHELAHIKRQDYAVNLLQSVVEVLYFFHPALWWLSARIREEREHCCDDLAAQACGNNRRLLAQALAHVEELRLTMSSTSPSLAMSFASRRQHLLHRVQRMLGVPTQPFVSNGSLVALTLSTLLLMSVSVYAIQNQEKPKARIRQNPPTRRHKIDANSAYELTNGNKINDVVWKGKKLSAVRIATLQRELNQIMAGQLLLDRIEQPDHDILLSIIEKNYSLDKGMADLARGLSQIDYNTISVTALNDVPLNFNEAAQELAAINYDSIIHDALTLTPTAQLSADSIIEPNVADVVRRQDSLLHSRELNREKIALLRAQAQTAAFAVEAVNRKIERLERQKSVLEQKRFSETSTQQHAILKSGIARTDSARQVSTKEIEAGEATIRRTEIEIEKLNQQLINTQSELENAEKPLRETEAQLQKLGYSQWLASASSIGPLGAQTRSLPALPRVPHPAPGPVQPLHGTAKSIAPAIILKPKKPQQPN